MQQTDKLSQEHSLSYEEDRHEMDIIVDAFKDYFLCV